EAGAADLVRVRVARDAVRQAGHAAGVQRRRTAREARDGEVRRAPEEVDGAALADEARAETLEHAIRLLQDLPEAPRGVGIVGGVPLVAIERNRLRDLVGLAVDPYPEAEPPELVEEAPVERGDRLRPQGDGSGRSVAGRDAKLLVHEIEV